MISILEKDGAVIITIENPTSQEKDLIAKAKNLKNSTSQKCSMFSKFKCNQSEQIVDGEQMTLNDNEWVSIPDNLDLDDLPFK